MTITPDDLRALTDEQLDQTRIDVLTEQERRQTIATAPEQATATAARYLDARDGPTDPDSPPEWVPPTGYHDAYAAGRLVIRDGKVYVSLRDGNNFEPGTDHNVWQEKLPDDAPPPEWEQRQAHNPYMKGDRVTFRGAVYESNIDNNAWSPADAPSAWDLID